MTENNTTHAPITIDQELLNNYISEAFRHHKAMDDAKGDLKLIGESLEEETGMKASHVLKYIKARYDDKVKDTKELSELFDQLDEATGA